jgi:hypothetical protein
MVGQVPRQEKSGASVAAGKGMHRTGSYTAS